MMGLSAVFLTLAMTQAADAPQWPVIQEFEVRMGFARSNERIDLIIPFTDRSGRVWYRLDCRGGSDAHLDRISALPGAVNYVGPLMCSLSLGAEETGASLLGEETDSGGPWHTRGQFAWKHFEGACATYPEYGRVRHFRLRGFELTLSVSEPEIDNDLLDDYVLTVSLRQDPSAKTARAEPSGYETPYRVGRSCEEIIPSQR